MRRISIYGAGHLTKSFLVGLNQTCFDRPIKMYNRTFDKVFELKNNYSKIIQVNNVVELVNDGSFVFLIIPPSAIIELDTNFTASIFKSNSLIVSCANYLNIDKLNMLFPQSKIVRLLPNINWQILQGTTIYAANSNVTKDDLSELFDILKPITRLYKANSDADFDTLGKLTSCGPGLFSKLIDQITISFGIPNDEQKQAIYQTLAGTMNYLIDSKKSPIEVISEVANNGGLTESGIIAANKNLSDCFDYISKSMDNRLIERKQMIK